MTAFKSSFAREIMAGRNTPKEDEFASLLINALLGADSGEILLIVNEMGESTAHPRNCENCSRYCNSIISYFQLYEEGWKKEYHLIGRCENCQKEAVFVWKDFDAKARNYYKALAVERRRLGKA